MQHAGSIDEVRWQQVFPWLLLFSAARSALLLNVVLITLVGALTTNFGWTALSRVTGVGPEAWPVVAEPTWDHLGTGPAGVHDAPQDAFRRGLLWEGNPLVRGWSVVAGPWLRVLSVDLSRDGLSRDGQSRDRIFLILCGVWSLVVWGVCGGAIAWITARRITQRERATAREAVQRAVAVWGSAIAGPAASLLAIGALCVPIVIAGWLLRFEPAAAIVAALWGGILAVGAVLVALLLGVLLGWPLMIITAAVDRSDPFDGVSRALAYVYQRPVHLLGYLLASGLLAAVVYLGVAFAVETTIVVTDEVASLGAGDLRATGLLTDADSAVSWAAWFLQQWRDGLRAGVRWFPLALFWSLATGIYLLLRFQIDETELDELAVDSE